MPRFNTTDHPIAQDNYTLIATASDDPRHDASVLGFDPAVLTDWNANADPGNLDAAVDQLAERIDDNESAIAELTSDHGALGGLADDDHAQYLLANGTRDVSGDMLMAGTSELRFGDSDRRVFSPATDVLALEGGTQLQMRIGGASEVLLFVDQMTFKQPGNNNPSWHWGMTDQLDLRLGSTVLASFKSQELDVTGVVAGTGMRADGTPPGVLGANTWTGASAPPDPLGTKPSMNKLPTGFATSSNAGWITVRVGTATGVIPYWRT